MWIKLNDILEKSKVSFGTSGVRGLVSNMTDEVCYAYTVAFKKAVVPNAITVVIGHDLRPSSPNIANSCARALIESGCSIIYAGALPTPALAWFGQQIDAPLVVVTGSHIPFDRNGIKFYRAEGEISKADEQAIQFAKVNVPDNLRPIQLGVPDPAARDSYILRYVDFFGPRALAGMTVALYEHSSVARDVLRSILENLGASVISLGRTDTFVPIDTEAVRAEDIAQAKTWASEYEFDALLSTDGDADRPLIGNEKGEWLRGDLVGVLCAQYLGADIVVTPVSSNTIVEKCGEFKKVLRTRIGSPYVIAGMQSELSSGQLVVGYEANGGFLLGSDFLRQSRTLRALPTRDAVLPMLAILRMAKDSQCKVSELAKRLPARFTASDRIQDFPQEKSAALIEELTNHPQKARNIMGPDSGPIANMDKTDGLRLEFSNGDISHLRPSGNAPELRCYAESSSEKSAQMLCDSCLKRLASS